MPLTVLAAALVVPLVGWIAGQFANEQLMLEARAAEMDRQLVGELKQRGWREATEDSKGQAFPSMPHGSALTWMSAVSVLTMDLGHGLVAASPPPEPKLREAMRVLSAEFARYPAGALRNIGLRRVLACSELTEAGRTIPSLPNVHSSLLIDVDAPLPYLRRLVHHEIYHFIDFADDAQLKSDPEWEALNAPQFRYGEGGRSMRRRGSARLTSSIPGFVTAYATSAVEEDKAEVFACLMMFPERVRHLARHDSIIASKVQFLRVELGERFPSLGRAFWESVLGESS